MKIHLDTAKTWAERLTQSAAGLWPGHPITLTQAQQAVADMLGYAHWDDLHTHLSANDLVIPIMEPPSTHEAWMAFWRTACELPGVSDLHIEKRKDQPIRVRARCHGRLIPCATFPDERLEEALSALLPAEAAFHVSRGALTGYVTGAMRLSGNTRIKQEIKELKYQTLPVYPEGMDCVIRVRDSKKLIDLDSMQLPQDVLLALRTLAERPEGMFLATGTAGSGKTSLLGAMLDHAGQCAHSDTSIRCYSMEDPPEGRMGPHTIYVPIKRGSNGALLAMNGVLKHGVEVLGIGEIRDQATAEAAIEALNAGVRVMATVFSSGRNVPERLEDFVPTHPWNDNVNGWANCRLFGVLCQTCSIPLPGGKGRRKWNKTGCVDCHHVGMSGRQLCVDIWERVDGVPQKTHCMRHQANRLVQQGLVDHDDVVAALGP